MFMAVGLMVDLCLCKSEEASLNFFDLRISVEPLPQNLADKDVLLFSININSGQIFLKGAVEVGFISGHCVVHFLCFL